MADPEAALKVAEESAFTVGFFARTAAKGYDRIWEKVEEERKDLAEKAWGLLEAMMRKRGSGEDEDPEDDPLLNKQDLEFGNIIAHRSSSLEAASSHVPATGVRRSWSPKEEGHGK